MTIETVFCTSRCLIRCVQHRFDLFDVDSGYLIGMKSADMLAFIEALAYAQSIAQPIESEYQELNIKDRKMDGGDYIHEMEECKPTIFEFSHTDFISYDLSVETRRHKPYIFLKTFIVPILTVK